MSGHSHDHSHSPKSFGSAFAVGIALNTVFVAIEATYGVLSGSLSLVADAGHNLSDVLGLILAWVASRLVLKKAEGRFTYGFKSSSILAALFNAVFILVITGGIIWEAIQRFSQPTEVGTRTVIVVATVGIFINGISALFFASGRKEDLNVRGAYLHLAADALVSVGVVVSGLVMSYTGWKWIDPVTSLAISVVVIAGSWGLLRDSVRLALHAAPEGIVPADVSEFLKKYGSVQAVHDLHIWAMSTTETALTCHLVVTEENVNARDRFLAELSSNLHERFEIDHVTIQLESNCDHGDC